MGHKKAAEDYSSPYSVSISICIKKGENLSAGVGSNHGIGKDALTLIRTLKKADTGSVERAGTGELKRVGH